MFEGQAVPLDTRPTSCRDRPGVLPRRSAAASPAECPGPAAACIGCYDADPDKARKQLKRLFTANGGPGLPGEPGCRWRAKSRYEPCCCRTWTTLAAGSRTAGGSRSWSSGQTRRCSSSSPRRTTRTTVHADRARTSRRRSDASRPTRRTSTASSALRQTGFSTTRSPTRPNTRSSSKWSGCSTRSRDNGRSASFRCSSVRSSTA